MRGCAKMQGSENMQGSEEMRGREKIALRPRRALALTLALTRGLAPTPALVCTFIRDPCPNPRPHPRLHPRSAPQPTPSHPRQRPVLAWITDNVHYQNGAVLAAELVDAGLPFEMVAYTDNDHRINTGANTQRDLYGRITKFLLAGGEEDTEA